MGPACEARAWALPPVLASLSAFALLAAGPPATAAWTEGRTALTISAVNPTLSAATLAMKLAGAKLAPAGTAYVLTGPSPDACNVPGKPPQVTVAERAATLGDTLEVPAMSATVFVFPAQ